MQTLKIQIPQGYEIDSFDKLSGELKLKVQQPKKEVTERIKTFDDVLQDNGIDFGHFDYDCNELADDEIAYRKLKLIAKSLNEGWTPDWSNSNEYKYFPWFEMRGSSGFRFDGYDYWNSGSYVGSRLAFKTSKLAEYAGKQFQSIYEQFMIIK